ncbi:hypothetical protein CYMTET_49608 [Cymbomonas tetramitiformis]|uniref:Uncharacterized protein n=1 Tax=Cymbomonas tetramitiformis TaxID=36881 RepID=A0AAE0BRH9_9CHLO|nr:hypothetical protein CYMTET_49608 [Cymbomonas tetramitiformis]
MEATTKLALQTLKSLSGEFVLSEQEFKTEKRKLFGKEGHSYILSPDLISELRELKSFFDDETLDRDEFDSQNQTSLLGQDCPRASFHSHRDSGGHYSHETISSCVGDRPCGRAFFSSVTFCCRCCATRTY